MKLFRVLALALFLLTEIFTAATENLDVEWRKTCGTGIISNVKTVFPCGGDGYVAAGWESGRYVSKSGVPLLALKSSLFLLWNIFFAFRRGLFKFGHGLFVFVFWGFRPSGVKDLAFF